MKDIDWIFELKGKVPLFLDRLKGDSIPGFFHYSLSGDLYGENVNWGLGNTVFAAKIYYTLGQVQTLSGSDVENMVGFIKRFQRSDGSIYDPLVNRKAALINVLSAIKNLNFSNWRPTLPYLKLPQRCDDIDRYLSRLDWSKPYHAGSHASHLLFFLQINREMGTYPEANNDDPVEYTINWLGRLQSSEDGGWHRGRGIPVRQRINGAMKVVTGLVAVGRPDFAYPEKLLDLCLSGIQYEQACDILDAIYVVHYANKLTAGQYRYSDIEQFCYNWLTTCHEHYFPEVGGLSFYKQEANRYYYGAKITQGKKEPDIHGTVLLLWGVALVSQILGIDRELEFKEFIS
jgi:hypothetical protein